MRGIRISKESEFVDPSGAFLRMHEGGFRAP